MFGKFIADTYNKVKSKADEVRQQVSVQAIKAKEVFGLNKPNTVEQLEDLLNQELQQIYSADVLIDTYKKWIYNMSVCEKSDCTRYFKSESQESMKPKFSRSNSNRAKPKINSKETGREQDNLKSTKTSEVEVNKYQIDFEKKENDTDNLEPSKHKDIEKKERTQHVNKEKHNNNNKEKYSSGSPLDQSNNTMNGPKENEEVNSLYDSQYGYTFKEVFLKSKIFEKSVSLIFEKRNIRLSLVGPIENEDVENPRTTILTMFKHCLIGDEMLHKDLLFIILTTDPLFDNHKELLLELISMLKYDYVDLFLSNLRKIISSEVICLKSKLNSYHHKSLKHSNSNFQGTASPLTRSSLNEIDPNIDPDPDPDIIEPESETYGDSAMAQSKVSFLKSDSIVNPELKSEPTQNVTKLCQIKQHDISSSNNVQENEIKDHQMEDYMFDFVESFSLNEQTSTEDGNKNETEINENEMIEQAKVQQIKILASSKLIELHKMVFKIFLKTAENREKRKEEIKIRLQELKKIMEVCKKDCDITINDTEGNKTHLENLYIKQFEGIHQNISTKQNEIYNIQKEILQLEKRKRELFTEYELVCKEINAKNKELSKITSVLSTHKRELYDAEDSYRNRLSNTSKAKHIHLERKFYISNLATISDRILNIYEEGKFTNTEELINKSKKIKKPMKQVIVQHLSHLKDKLLVLNSLLQWYVTQLKDFSKECKNNSRNTSVESKNTTNEEGPSVNGPESKHLTKKVELTEEEKKKRILLKYRKSYFNVTNQLNKTWLNIQKFYDHNKEEMEDEAEETQEINENVKKIQKEIIEIYDIAKQIIRDNNEIILSIC